MRVTRGDLKRRLYEQGTAHYGLIEDDWEDDEALGGSRRCGSSQGHRRLHHHHRHHSTSARADPGGSTAIRAIAGGGGQCQQGGATSSGPSRRPRRPHSAREREAAAEAAADSTVKVAVAVKLLNSMKTKTFAGAGTVPFANLQLPKGLLPVEMQLKLAMEAAGVEPEQSQKSQADQHSSGEQQQQQQQAQQAGSQGLAARDDPQKSQETVGGLEPQRRGTADGASPPNSRQRPLRSQPLVAASSRPKTARSLVRDADTTNNNGGGGAGPGAGAIGRPSTAGRAGGGNRAVALPPLASAPASGPPAVASTSGNVATSPRGGLSPTAFDVVPKKEPLLERRPLLERVVDGISAFEVFTELLRGAAAESLEEGEALQFVYVQRVAGGGPYDLELVSFTRIDPKNYMTVSPSGFTEYVGGTPVAFCPLEEWLTERQLYKAVRKFRFFSEFAKRKSFHLWRDAGCRERMSKASVELKGRLFWLDWELRPLLLSIRESVLEISELRLLRTGLSHPHSLKDFRALQQEWQGDIATRVLRLVERIRTEVCEAFSHILDRVRRETRGPNLALEDLSPSSPSAHRRKPQAIRGGKEKGGFRQGASKGMPRKVDSEALEALGFPKDIGFGLRSMLRKECSRFTRFALLADTLLMDALRALTLGSVADVVRGLSSDEMRNQHSTRASQQISMMAVRTTNKSLKKGQQGRQDEGAAQPGLIFKVQVTLQTNPEGRLEELIVSPEPRALAAYLTEAITTGCRSTVAFQKLMEHSSLKPYQIVLNPIEATVPVEPKLAAPVEDEVTPSDIFVEALQSEDTWKDYMKRLDKILDAAFQQANVEMAALRSHLERCRECQDANVAAFVQQGVTVDGIKALGDLLMEYRTHIDQLQELPQNFNFRVVDIDISSVKAGLLVAPKRCLSELHNLLPQLILDQARDLADWMVRERAQLDMQPRSLLDFVEQLYALQRVGIEAIARMHQLERVGDLNNLTETHGVPGCGPGRKQAVNTARDFSDFRQWIASKELEVSHNRPAFVQELMQLRESLSKELEELTQEVGEEQFLTLATEDATYKPGSEWPDQEAYEEEGKMPFLFRNEEGVSHSKLVTDAVWKESQLTSRFEQATALGESYTKLAEFEDALELERSPDPSPKLNPVLQGLEVRLAMWSALTEIQRETLSWLQQPLSELDVTQLSSTLSTLAITAARVEEVLPKNPVIADLNLNLLVMQEAVPALQALQSDKLKGRHWQVVSKLLDRELDPVLKPVLVGEVISANIGKRVTELQTLAARAQQEHVNEVLLSEIEEKWGEMELTVMPHKELRDSFVVAFTERMEAALQEDLLRLKLALASPFAEAHLEATQSWQYRLMAAEQFVTRVDLFQEQWVRLGRTFSLADMQKQLPSECSRFHQVATYWKELTSDIQAKPTVINIAAQSNLTEALQDEIQTLEEIQQELQVALESKRRTCPRLYFVSDQELISMLSKSRQAGAMSQHVALVFPGLQQAELPEDRISDIQAVIADNGDRLVVRVKVRLHIEETLGALQTAMVSALHRATKQRLEEGAAAAAENDYTLWASSPSPSLGPSASATSAKHQCPQQASLIALQILWCAHIEKCFSSNGKTNTDIVKDLLSWTHAARLEPLLQALREGKIPASRRDQASQLVVHEVCRLALLEKMFSSCAMVEDLKESLDWQQHLRHYWEGSSMDEPHGGVVPAAATATMASRPATSHSIAESAAQVVSRRSPGQDDGLGTCVAVQCGIQFHFGFEFMGDSSPFVVTPPSERCWMSLCQASRERMGVAVTGEPGSGKTETIKALASALGYMCKVYACTSSATSSTISRLLAGAVQQGCWFCFDDVDRISLQVLGVVAGQLQKIHSALLADEDHAEIDGNLLPIKKTLSFSATLRSSGQPWNDLPESFRECFRPFALPAVDTSIVLQALFFAHGFRDAKFLAKRVTSFLESACRLLKKNGDGGSNTTLDWNLATWRLGRLTTRCGQLQSLMQAQERQALKPVQEHRIVADALMQTYMQSVSTTEFGLFEGLVADTFSGSPIDSVTMPVEVDERAGDVRRSLEELLPNSPIAADKGMQVYHCQDVSRGTIVCGDAGAGKSALLQTLATAMTVEISAEMKLKSGRLVHRLNLKSASFEDTFGSTLPNGDFSEGMVATALARYRVPCHLEDLPWQFPWLVLDGPIDGDWAEHLNLLLSNEASKLRCGPELWSLSQDLRILLETDDLSCASPSTVGRCGLVHFPRPEYLPGQVAKEMVGQRPSWLVQSHWDHCMRLLRSVLPKAWKQLQLSLPLGHMLKGDAYGLLSIFRLTLESLLVEPPRKAQGGLVRFTMDSEGEGYISACFGCALVWTLGLAAPPNLRNEFQSWCKANIPKLTVPSGLELFDVYVDATNPPSFLSAWQLQIDPKSNGNPCINDIFIPTPASECCKAIAFSRAQRGKHVLLVGCSGSGKTSIARHILAARCEAPKLADSSVSSGGSVRSSISRSAARGFVPLRLHLGKQTSAGQVQALLWESYQGTRQRQDVRGSPQLVWALVDDISAPLPDKSGAQHPGEVLRQLLDEGGGLYERRVWHFRQWKEVAMLALGTTASLPNVSSRLARHYQPIFLPEWTKDSLSTLFGGVLRQCFFEVELMDERLSNRLVSAAVDLHYRVSSKLVGPRQLTCFYSVHDIARVFAGMALVQDETLLKEPHDFVKLWVHEASREYRDRLLSSNDTEAFNAMLESSLQCGFNTQWRPSLEPCPLRYSCFKRSSVRAVYQHLSDVAALQETFGELLQDLNSDLPPGHEPLQMLFFEDVLNHLCRLLRAFSLARRHILLVGVEGSGRRSLCQLASFAAEKKLKRLEKTPSLDVESLLKQMMRSCACKNEAVSLMVDHDDEQDINIIENLTMMMKTGELPNSWTAEEVTVLARDLQLLDANDPFTPEVRNLVSRTLTSKSEAQLHVTLSVAPRSQLLKRLVRSDPDFLSRCFVDIVRPWGEVALLEVASASLCCIPESVTKLVSSTSLASTIMKSFGLASEICSSFHMSREAGFSIYDLPDSTSSNENCEDSSNDRNGNGSNTKNTVRWSHAESRGSMAVSRASPRVSTARNTAVAAVVAATTTGTELASPRSSSLKTDKAIVGDFQSIVGSTVQTAFARLFASLLNRLHAELSTRVERIKKASGLLQKQARIVAQAESDSEGLQPRIDLLKSQTAGLLAEANREKAKKTVVIRTLDGQQEAVASQRLSIEDTQREIKQTLETGLADIKSALKSVDRVDKKEFQELKNTNIAPPAVTLVMECLLLLFGQKTDWQSARAFLSENTNLSKKLKEFDKDSISDKIVARFKVLIKKDEFEPSVVEQHGKAPRALCLWCRAISTYHDLSNEAAPRRAQLEEMEASLKRMEERLQARETELQDTEKLIESLEEQRQAKVQETQDLEVQKMKGVRRLQVAKILRSLLGDHEKTWRRQLEHTQGQLQRLPGSLLVAAAMITFAGAMDGLHRSRVLAVLDAVCSEAPGLHSGLNSEDNLLLLPESVPRDWQQSFPEDTLGGPVASRGETHFLAQSVLMAANSWHWPLCIDPQGQAQRWLRQHLPPAMSMADISAKNSKEIDSKLCQAMQNGKSVVMVECEEMLPWVLRCPSLLSLRYRLAKLRSSDIEKFEEAMAIAPTMSRRAKPGRRQSAQEPKLKAAAGAGVAPKPTISIADDEENEATDAEQEEQKQQPIEPDAIEQSTEVVELLDPSASSETSTSNKAFVNFFGKTFQAAENFALYLTTTVSRPNFASWVYNKFSVVDFTMPFGDVTQELLRITSGQDVVLVESISRLQQCEIELRHLREKVLLVVAESEDSGRSVDEQGSDGGLVGILHHVEHSSDSMAREVDDCLSQVAGMERVAAPYRQLSTKFSWLFWTLTAFSRSNLHYETTLENFLQVAAEMVHNVRLQSGKSSRRSSASPMTPRGVISEVKRPFPDRASMMSSEMSSKEDNTKPKKDKDKDKEEDSLKQDSQTADPKRRGSLTNPPRERKGDERERVSILSRGGLSDDVSDSEVSEKKNHRVSLTSVSDLSSESEGPLPPLNEEEESQMLIDVVASVIEGLLEKHKVKFLLYFSMQLARSSDSTTTTITEERSSENDEEALDIEVKEDPEDRTISLMMQEFLKDRTHPESEYFSELSQGASLRGSADLPWLVVARQLASEDPASFGTLPEHMEEHSEIWQEALQTLMEEEFGSEVGSEAGDRLSGLEAALSNLSSSNGNDNRGSGTARSSMSPDHKSQSLGKRSLALAKSKSDLGSDTKEPRGDTEATEQENNAENNPESANDGTIQPSEKSSADSPFCTGFPSPWERPTLSPIRSLLLIRRLTPTRFPRIVISFIQEMLHSDFGVKVESPPPEAASEEASEGQPSHQSSMDVAQHSSTAAVPVGTMASVQSSDLAATATGTGAPSPRAPRRSLREVLSRQGSTLTMHHAMEGFAGHAFHRMMTRQASVLQGDDPAPTSSRPLDSSCTAQPPS